MGPGRARGVGAISVIGTGPDLNSATDNGLERAAELLGMEVPEVKNRATISVRSRSAATRAWCR